MSKTRAILALILTYVLYAMLLNSVGTVILQAVRTFDVGKPQASVLEACKDLSIALASLVFASALPSLGYRRLLVGAPLAVCAACLAMPMLHAFAMTEILFVVVGLSFGVSKVAVYSSIGLLTDTPKGHASLTTLVEGLFMVGVVASGWLFSAFVRPGDAAGHGWLDVYWVLAAIALASALLWLVSPLDEGERRTSDLSSLAGGYLDMARLMARPLVCVFLASAFFYVLVEQSIGTWLPTFLNEVLRLPPALSIQMTTLYAGSLAAGRLTASALLRRVDWFWVLAPCVVAMALLILFVLPNAHGAALRGAATWADAPPVAFALPLIGVLMSPIYPTLNSVVLSAMPRAGHAALTGLIVVFSALGGTFGSLLTGLAFSRLGGVAAFYGTLLPMTLLLAAMVVLRRWTHMPSTAKA